GIVIFSATNILTGNTATNNGADGINLDGAEKNLVKKNTASNNFDEGFEVFGANNLLQQNVAKNNSGSGIEIELGGTKNKITGNTAQDNGDTVDEFDFKDENANCDSNKWSKNKTGIKSQSCIR
ncbi:MAG: right-handed parallel beta-helix repeat-containing protein, partial [Candidatus Binatia bacterium]